MNAEEWEEWEEAEVLPTHPIKNGRWVVSVAEIRCNATGEVSEYEGPELLMDGDESPNTHIWSDGNFGCDCNRRFFFSRAGGKDEERVVGIIGDNPDGFGPIPFRRRNGLFGLRECVVSKSPGLAACLIA